MNYLFRGFHDTNDGDDDDEVHHDDNDGVSNWVKGNCTLISFVSVWGMAFTLPFLPLSLLPSFPSHTSVKLRSASFYTGFHFLLRPPLPPLHHYQTFYRSGFSSRPLPSSNLI